MKTFVASILRTPTTVAVAIRDSRAWSLFTSGCVVLLIGMFLVMSAGVPAMAGSTAVPPRTIGPDAFGYIGTNNVPFAFSDISGTGTVILADTDDDSVSVPIGFGFSFYGTGFANVFVSSNGLLTFGGADAAYDNMSLLTTSVGLPAIAVMWDDLSLIHI